MDTACPTTDPPARSELMAQVATKLHELGFRDVTDDMLCFEYAISPAFCATFTDVHRHRPAAIRLSFHGVAMRTYRQRRDGTFNWLSIEAYLADFKDHFDRLNAEYAEQAAKLAEQQRAIAVALGFLPATDPPLPDSTVPTTESVVYAGTAGDFTINIGPLNLHFADPPEQLVPFLCKVFRLQPVP